MLNTCVSWTNWKEKEMATELFVNAYSDEADEDLKLMSDDAYATEFASVIKSGVSMLGIAMFDTVEDEVAFRRADATGKYRRIKVTVEAVDD